MAMMTQAINPVLKWGALSIAAGASAGSIYGGATGHGFKNRVKRYYGGYSAGGVAGYGAYRGMRLIAANSRPGNWASRASSAIGRSSMNRGLVSGLGMAARDANVIGWKTLGKAYRWMSQL